MKITTFSAYTSLAPLGLLLTFMTGPSIAENGSPAIATGMQVSFSYDLSIDGDVIESNVDAAPLVYTQGAGQILEALEAELAGMHVGDTKSVQLSAAEAYGEVSNDAIQEIPIAQVPESTREVGALLQAEGFPGPIRVVDVRKDVVVLDFNHPLAGKALTFDVTIVDVQPAPAAVAN